MLDFVSDLRIFKKKRNYVVLNKTISIFLGVIFVSDSDTSDAGPSGEVKTKSATAKPESAFPTPAEIIQLNGIFLLSLTKSKSQPACLSVITSCESYKNFNIGLVLS